LIDWLIHQSQTVRTIKKTYFNCADSFRIYQSFTTVLSIHKLAMVSVKRFYVSPRHTPSTTHAVNAVTIYSSVLLSVLWRLYARRQRWTIQKYTDI